MTRHCNWTETTSGEPCSNPVGNGSTHCAAGHPVAAYAVATSQGSRHGHAAVEQPTLDLEATLGTAAHDPSRMYTDDGDVVYDDRGDVVECLDKRKGGCDGGVEFHLNPYSSSFKSYPRCSSHAGTWFDSLEAINNRYPDSPVAPSWFDESAAGERWDDDY